MLEVPQVPEYPKKVDPENILHFIILGHAKSGKTNIAKKISALHKEKEEK